MIIIESLIQISQMLPFQVMIFSILIIPFSDTYLNRIYWPGVLNNK